MKTKTIILFIIFSLSSILLAQEEMDVDKTFKNIKSLRIKLVLGNCVLKKSADADVHVHLLYTRDDQRFEPRFIESGNRLTLEEKFYGHDGDGKYQWTVQIPAGLEVDLESATGGIRVEGAELEIDGNTGTGGIKINDASGKFELSTGTGGIEAKNSQGEFELSSGTGGVLIEECQGNFDVSSGTGKVKGVTITIESDAEFNSGTGSVEITAPAGKDFDLEINSGTGDAILDMQGKALEGYFEFTAHARTGKIISPEKFDQETTYGENDEKYLQKSFTRGKATPRYFISTGTGDAELKK
jgi:hypothetical protein